MTPTPIFKDHTGKWREVNPFEKYQTNAVGDSTWKHTDEYNSFEQSITYHEFPNAPEVKPGEVVMAYLQWQLKLNDVWYNSVEPTAYNKEYYRQIWVLAVNQEGKEEQAKETRFVIYDKGQPLLSERFEVHIKDIKNEDFLIVVRADFFGAEEETEMYANDIIKKLNEKSN